MVPFFFSGDTFSGDTRSLIVSCVVADWDGLASERSIDFVGVTRTSDRFLVSSALRARTSDFVPILRSSTEDVLESPPARAALVTVTGSAPLSVTVVDTVTGAPADAATVVENTPS